MERRAQFALLWATATFHARDSIRIILFLPTLATRPAHSRNTFSTAAVTAMGTTPGRRFSPGPPVVCFRRHRIVYRHRRRVVTVVTVVPRDGRLRGTHASTALETDTR